MADLKIRARSGSVTEVLDWLRFRELPSINMPSWRFPKWLRWSLLGCLAAGAMLYELRTSALQSRILSGFARKMSYAVGDGPSPNIVFPKHGPFDVRAGYALIPGFERRLAADGFRVTQQARFSDDLERATRWGILPPYAERTSTELTIRGMDGQPLFQAPVAGYAFNSFEEIPPLAVKSLLIIENRELSEPADSRTNPVVDWDRLAKAAVLYTGHKLGLPVPVEGGSTLATQMVKYRHSYDGKTDSALAKLRQMTNASLQVYHRGPDTREERRRIILDYLNSIPLAAAPGYGEIHGIGNGLHAWFGLQLHDVRHALSMPDDHPGKAGALKHLLALMCAVKAPSYYLVRNRDALDARARYFARMLANAQVISKEFSDRVAAAPIRFESRPPKRAMSSYAESKAVNDIRSKLVTRLGLPGLYELDRLDLEVESTIHPRLQHSVAALFEKLHDPAFLDEAGLRGERLLARGDPSRVIYGMMLYEKTPDGNMLRVVTDSLNAPFDINTGMKMQLGSTAKLRVLVNYLDVAASLHATLAGADDEALRGMVDGARDPITLWAAETLLANRGIGIDAFLALAMDREYSANPGEVFFTGGGAHAFRNFDSRDDGRTVTIREATVRSVNLAYVRLMRDLVRYYEARLPYDTQGVLADPGHPERRRMLGESADQESRFFLLQAYRKFRKLPQREIVSGLLGQNAGSPRHLAILFYAWHRGADETALARWLERHTKTADPEMARRMAKAYGNPDLTPSDTGYLLGIHPLRVWCAGMLARDPSMGWDRILKESAEARRMSSAWLFQSRNRTAQERRLRVRFEQDAFVRIAAEWKRLGFPFDRLVPSLATALGSSGDRPEALAQLMGILVNDGKRMPSTRMVELRFAKGTPYETALEPARSPGVRVIPPAVARTVLPVLAQVVQSGSAARLSGAYRIGDRPLIVGGKTGSGDNRLDTVGRWGQRTSSRSLDRTAVFAFYLGDRYFGVLTSFVPGKDASEYGFTSSLPVALLKMLSPDIQTLWQESPGAARKELTLASNAGAAAGSAPMAPAALARRGKI